MKKKAISIILMTVMLTLTGCGTQATSVQAISTNNVVEVSATTENVNTPIESTAIEETSSIPEIETETEATSTETVEPIYTEYEDLFLAENFSKLNREKLEGVDRDNIEKTNEKFVLSESVDLYNFEGTWNGYSKPNITVTLFGTTEDWAEVSFISTVLYVQRTDFDRVAVKADLLATTTTTPVQETTPVTETPATEASKPVTEKPKTETPKTETTTPATEPIAETEPVVVESNKYTPEEAVAVYRSIMEANGISWNPALKNGGSWGTGWISLTKGQPEWAGNSAVESYRIGNSVGRSWDSYYLEVTGSDANAVYITEWHN